MLSRPTEPPFPPRARPHLDSGPNAPVLLFLRLDGGDADTATVRLRELPGVGAVHRMPGERGHLVELHGIAPAQLMPMLQEHFEAIPTVRAKRRAAEPTTLGRRLLVYQ